MGVDGGIRFPSQGGSLGITDGKHLCPALLRVTHRHQGVHGFPGLADCNNKALLVNNWLAIAELMSKLNAGSDFRPLFKRILSDFTRIGSSAAGNDCDAVDLGESIETSKLA